MKISKLIKSLCEAHNEYGDLDVRRPIGRIGRADGQEKSIEYALAFDKENKTQTEYDDAGMSGFKPTHFYIN